MEKIPLKRNCVLMKKMASPFFVFTEVVGDLLMTWKMEMSKAFLSSYLNVLPAKLELKTHKPFSLPN